MEKISRARNAKGFECIYLKKDLNLAGINEICNFLEKEIEEKSDYSINVSIDIQTTLAVIDIDVQDWNYDRIGTVEYMCQDFIATDSDCLEFELIGTNPANKTYTQEEWDDIFDFIVEIIVNLL